MLDILRPGLQSTLQDRGRRARHLGLPSAGAADPWALRLANSLVGNPPWTTALELTASAMSFQFRERTLVSLCGAPFIAALDGIPFPLWRSALVEPGQILELEPPLRGWRAVLAVRGGFQGETVLGSRSTDLRSGLGGWRGRALRRGDLLPYAPLSREVARPTPAFVRPEHHSPTGPAVQLRVLSTREATPEYLEALLERSWTVSPQLDRMGARLQEDSGLRPDAQRLSQPNVPGAVQVPPNGQPILLLPDAGTHGGYCTPLVVCQADLPKLGQLRPGDSLTFTTSGTATRPGR